MENKNYYYYEYSIRFWDEIDEKEDFRLGVVAAKSYSEAILKISEYYGEGNLLSFEKILCCSEYLYEFNADDNSFEVEVE